MLAISDNFKAQVYPFYLKLNLNLPSTRDNGHTQYLSKYAVHSISVLQFRVLGFLIISTVCSSNKDHTVFQYFNLEC